MRRPSRMDPATPVRDVADQVPETRETLRRVRVPILDCSSPSIYRRYALSVCSITADICEETR